MDWPLARLGDIVCRLTNGYVGATKNIYQDDGVPYLLARHVKDNVLEFDGKTYVSNEFNQKNKKSILKRGDVLLVQSGHIGHTAVVTQEHDGHNCHAMIVMTPKEEILGEYLSLFFNFLLASGEILKIRTGSTVPHLTCKLVKELKIPLPSIPEQKRIVAILDQAFADIDKARALTEQNLKNARELFESYLQQVFSRRGEGWVDTTLGQATGGVFTGPFGSLLHKSDYIENGIPLVNPAHITPTGIEADYRKTVSEETADKLSSYVMRAGDIVIGRRGEMGRCALINDDEDGFLCGTGSFFMKSSGRVVGSYLVRYLRSDFCRIRLERIAGGAVMPNLSNSDLSNFNLYLPPVRQQKEISTLVDEISLQLESVVEIYSRKIVALDELKKALLQKAFSGELTKDNKEAAA